MALTKINNAAISSVTNAGLPALDHTNMPVGTVVQFKRTVMQNSSSISWNGTSATGSQSYGSNRGGRTFVEARQISITPKSTSNILYCVGLVGWTSMGNTATMAHGQIITRNDGTDSIDNSDYPWYPHSSFLTGGSYFPAEHVSGIFTPASTSAQIIRLRPYIYMETAGGTGTAIYQNASLFVMEIKE